MFDLLLLASFGLWFVILVLSIACCFFGTLAINCTMCCLSGNCIRIIRKSDPEPPAEEVDPGGSKGVNAKSNKLSGKTKGTSKKSKKASKKAK